MRTRQFFGVALAVLALTCAGERGLHAGKPSGGGGGSTTPPPSYSIQLLGTLPGGESSYANGMNNRGDVVGYYRSDILGRVIQRGFLNVGDGSGLRLMIDLTEKFTDEGIWTANGMVPCDFQSLSGSYVHSGQAINDNGQMVVVISTLIPGQPSVIAPYRYSPATRDATGNLIPAHVEPLVGHAWSGKINAPGDVASSNNREDGYVHALLWEADTQSTTDLGIVLGRDARVWDLNDFGQLCGGNNLWYRAWRYTPGSGYQDLGVLKGGYSSFAQGINNGGQVAVTCRMNAGEFRICRFTDGQGLKSLGSLGVNGGEAAGINSSGAVVGSYWLSDQTRRLCLYTDQSGLFTLNDVIINLPEAANGGLVLPFDGGRPLNDAGQVCGTAGWNTPLPDGHANEAFLLTPVSP